MFLQVVGVVGLSSQLWSVFDNFIWFDKFVASKPSRVLLSTPSRSPISYQLEETEGRNLSSICFSGLESVTMYKIYYILNCSYVNYKEPSVAVNLTKQNA